MQAFTLPPRCAKCFADHPDRQWAIGLHETTDTATTIVSSEYTLKVPVCQACSDVLGRAERGVVRAAVGVGAVAALAVVATGLVLLPLEPTTAVVLVPAAVVGGVGLYAALWAGVRVGPLAFGRIRRYGVHARVVGTGAVALLVAGAVLAACLATNVTGEQRFSLVGSALVVGTLFTWWVPGYMWAQSVDFLWPHFTNRDYRAAFEAANADAYNGPGGPRAQLRKAFGALASDAARAALMGLIVVATVGVAGAVAYYATR